MCNTHTHTHTHIKTGSNKRYKLNRHLQKYCENYNFLFVEETTEKRERRTHRSIYKNESEKEREREK
jgi:hypothetical protein